LAKSTKHNKEPDQLNLKDLPAANEAEVEKPAVHKQPKSQTSLASNPKERK
ncbi:hypothetical protein SK128_005879, partial [Halocaridina rubra]